MKIKKNISANNLKGQSRLGELLNSVGEFWREFKQVKYGIMGLILLFLFILMIILEPFIIAFPEGGSRWNDISYWRDNPKNAAPVWINWFSSKKRAVHQFLNQPELDFTETAQFKVMEGFFTYNYSYDQPPSELTFKARSRGKIILEVEMERPDGEVIRLLRKDLKSNNEMRLNIPFSKEAESRAISFASLYESSENTANISRLMTKPMNIIFAEAEEGILVNPRALKGDYQIRFKAVLMGDDAFLEDPEIIVSGKVFGLLGTDDSKRDVWTGIVAGIKWAIFIGLLTAFVSVTIGVIYGVTSAYFGGWIDSLMMRVFEIFVSIPMLPVLIVLAALYKPSIWNLILIMCVFYWTGPVRTVRSIGLQIKEETYVEAAHALNASHGRIIFKHMIPQLIPYAFASMALSVPGAIVAEASISLLGLGDASIVTWGQILHSAMHNSAVLKGLWWWVVPPGLTIALMGMTFAFIGFSMDKILNPKLKTR
ncbi:MAG: ABC transporter permease [Halanaerobiales bacterium]